LSDPGRSSSGYVLDASALLALIQAEAGSERVAEVLGGAVISAINLAEVVSRLADRGVPGEAIRRQLARLDLGVVPVDENLAYAAGLLRPAMRAGLSLGDRVCIALARRLGATALTTDRAWAQLEIGVAVQVLRVR
jgi:ribonuclease VapC